MVGRFGPIPAVAAGTEQIAQSVVRKVPESASNPPRRLNYTPSMASVVPLEAPWVLKCASVSCRQAFKVRPSLAISGIGQDGNEARRFGSELSSSFW